VIATHNPLVGVAQHDEGGILSDKAGALYELRDRREGASRNRTRRAFWDTGDPYQYLRLNGTAITTWCLAGRTTDRTRFRHPCVL